MAWACAACSPTFNWRESRLDTRGAVAMFPCKPARLERSVALAGVTTPLEMQSCEAGGSIFALSSADVDPSRVSDVLLQWQKSAGENLGASPKVIGPARVAGMTPQAQAVVVRLEGQAPDRSPLSEQAVFFARGSAVFQAAVVSRAWNQEAADTFFEGLRLP